MFLVVGFGDDISCMLILSTNIPELSTTLEWISRDQCGQRGHVGPTGVRLAVRVGECYQLEDYFSGIKFCTHFFVYQGT